MRCRYAPVHDEVRGICDALGLDYDRIATDRAGMLWAGEGDASPLRRMLRDQRHREAPARPVPRCRFPFGKPRAAARGVIASRR